MEKRMGTKFWTNGTADTKAVVVVESEKVCLVWGRPARELHKYQSARGTKIY